MLSNRTNHPVVDHGEDPRPPRKTALRTGMPRSSPGIREVNAACFVKKVDFMWLFNNLKAGYIHIYIYYIYIYIYRIYIYIHTNTHTVYTVYIAEIPEVPNCGAQHIKAMGCAPTQPLASSNFEGDEADLASIHHGSQ